MRYQQGKTPQQGSQPSNQDQMAQSEAPVWPFKPMDHGPEIGSPEFAPESLNESPQQGRFSRPKQQG